MNAFLSVESGTVQQAPASSFSTLVAIFILYLNIKVDKMMFLRKVFVCIALIAAAKLSNRAGKFSVEK